MTRTLETNPQSLKTAHSAVKFFAPGEPATQGSKNAYLRHGKITLVETNKKLATWRHTIVTIAAAQQHKIPAGTPVCLTVEFVLPRTKAMGTKPAPPMVQKPDLDKLARATGDGLTQAGIIADDNQINEMHLYKRRAQHGEETGAHIYLQTKTQPTKTNK